MFSRSYQLLFASGALLLSSGCAMCCGLYDNDYLATSELLERTEASQGRVGSVFSDPNVAMTGHWSEGTEMMPMAPDAIESLPQPMDRTMAPQPTPAAPTTSPPSRELIQRTTPTPAKPTSVKENPQARRTTPAPSVATGEPRKLATAPGSPLPSSRRFSRQPIHQVTARQ